MTTYDVQTTKLLEAVAEELKAIEAVKPPVWSKFCKTGSFRERPPANKDWWFLRSASVLRKLARIGPIGTSKLRVLYGGKGNRGVDAEKFVKGSGNILRKILQQLEKAGFAKQAEKGVHKGRVITPKGLSLLDKCASKFENNGKKQASKQEEKAQ